jgi:CheY-like chemotaxis protein
VQGIVLQSEGAIRVLSRVGLGSTFILYLPIVAEQDDDSQLRQDFNMPRGTERILFVDDEEVLAEVTQEMLQKLGYKVEIQTNSVEALHRFRAQPGEYDLLITDQTMPDMSGMELAREALDIRSDIPVVLYTGYSSSIDESALRRIGIQNYLMKPLSMTKLATVIRQILDA